MNNSKKMPPKLSGIMQKVLSCFIIWNSTVKTLTKDHRYSTGLKITNLFTDIIEQTSLAQFNSTDTLRVVYIDRAVAKNDTLKFMVFVLYELRAIDDKKFINLSLPIEEVGKMLYGWKRSIETKKKTP